VREDWARGGDGKKDEMERRMGWMVETMGGMGWMGWMGVETMMIKEGYVPYAALRNEAQPLEFDPARHSTLRHTISYILHLGRRNRDGS
jgi:hypothetical protein